MSTIERAIQIAAKAHEGVRDKQDAPYLMHPIRVMLGAGEGAGSVAEAAQIVGVLHDVVEDTDTTLDDLRREGFSDEVLVALDLVTHRDGQPYVDYVVACRPNEIARRVKLADLRDNASLSRLLVRPEKFATDAKRMQKYALSYKFLTDEIDEADYRRLLADHA